MNHKLAATAVALVLGLATPLALSGAASAQEAMVNVTFADGVVGQYALSEAAELCGVAEELIADGACNSGLESAEAEGVLDDGPANENSARAFAPGQLKGEGESARDYAPGQTKEPGESARDSAPGQQKKN